VKRPDPRSSHVEPRLHGTPTRRKPRQRSRERARCGCTQVVRVADVGWTHRASSAPGGRKASWSERALARRKLEAPPDAGHGWREGEMVRGCARFLIVLTHNRPVGFGSQVQDTTKGVSGLLPVLLSPAGRSTILGLQVKSRLTLPKGVRGGQRIGRRNRLGRACK
jgi:hypothetical protein